MFLQQYFFRELTFAGLLWLLLYSAWQTSMFVIFMVNGVWQDESVHIRTNGLAQGATAWMEARKQGSTESPGARVPMATPLPVLSPNSEQARLREPGTLEACLLHHRLAIWVPSLTINFSRVTPMTSRPPVFPIPILNCFLYPPPEKKNYHETVANH